MTATPTIAHTREELTHALEPLKGRLGLVMTMGALHEGHLSLVKKAYEHADHVVVSIFVNPTQFAPGEDFEAYPRTFESDIEKLRSIGVDVVFAPSDKEIYPSAPQVTINPGPISTVLEGKTRPTHFAGVALVVTKVLNMVRPDIAVFGQKDAQQLTLIRQIVADLNIPVQIIGAPIVRDEKGLAVSSRNMYLSAEEKNQALSLSRALADGRTAARNGASPKEILAVTQKILTDAQGIEPDYVALANTRTFDLLTQDSKAGNPCEAYLLVAARVGKTRLIDNQIVTVQ